MALRFKSCVDVAFQRPREGLDIQVVMLLQIAAHMAVVEHMPYPQPQQVECFAFAFIHSHVSTIFGSSSSKPRNRSQPAPGQFIAQQG